MLHAGKAEELALRILGFGEAVGSEGQPVSGLELEAGDGESGAVEGAERECAFDGDGLAVEVGRQVSGVGEGDGAVGGDAQGEAGGEGFAAAEETAVEGLKKRSGSRVDSAVERMAPTSRATSMPACSPLPATSPATMRRLPSHGTGNDLEEVAADLAGGAVFAFDDDAGKGGTSLGEDDALDFLGLLNVKSEDALVAQRQNQSAQEKDGEDHDQQQSRRYGEVDLNAEGKPCGAQAELLNLVGKLGGGFKKDGRKGEPAFDALLADASEDDEEQEGSHSEPEAEGDGVANG